MSEKADVEKLRRLRDDPVAFAEMVMDWHPFPYQENLLRDDSRRIVGCWGRQCGKTTTIAVKAIHFAFAHPRTTTLIVSPSLRQSIIMFDCVLELVYGNRWLPASVVRKTRTVVELDNGYPSGGNYWSDYNGTDFYSGPYQNETGSDGIGDTPYVIDDNNQDSYPLMKPWGPTKTVFNITWNEETYPVTVVSNSTITDFNFSQPLKQISFNITGPNSSTGFCNITIPKELLNGDFTVLIDGQLPLTLILTENETHTSLYFTYTHTTHQVQIIGTTVVGEEEKALLGTGWGWLKIAHKEYVHGRAELYKISDTQIELVITYQGEEYSRTWNIICHREYKYHETYFCFSLEHGPLIVGVHRARWTFWWAVGKDTIAFGLPRYGRPKLMPI